MSSLPTEIEKQEGGAVFVRADLHIHSFGEGGSYDVTDTALAPEAIVDSALAAGIKVIAIADHHKGANSRVAVDYSTDKDILVIPAVEFSTNEGHVLVYAETNDQIDSILAVHEFSADKKSCQATMKQVIDTAVKYGGFAIAAHINNEKGFDNAIVGYGDPKRAVLLHEGLLGLEVSKKDELAMFTAEDEREERRILSQSKVDDRGFTVAERARIMSSDAHRGDQLWKNQSGEERITRLKMTDLSFEAAKTAFLDPTARVRVEDTIPVSTPHFIGIKFEGGFLDGQVVKFNKNLNAIIGGRGSGKSTFLESIKTASGNETSSLNEKRLVDGDVWADKITLLYKDEAGNITTFVRSKNGALINETDPTEGLTRVQIESYGQGDLMKVIADSTSEPAVLMDFLDGFINFEDLKEKEQVARNLLMTNSSDISALEGELSQLPKFKQLLADAKAKLEKLKSGKAKELVELEQALSEEKSIRVEIRQEIDDRKTVAQDALSDVEGFDITSIILDKEIKAGQSELSRIQELIADYAKVAKDTSSDFTEKTSKIITEMDAKIDEWDQKEATLLGQIETKKQQLVAAGVTLDTSYIRKITNDYTKYFDRVRELERKQVQYVQLLKDRKQLIGDRDQHKRDVCAKRLAFAKEINKHFEGSIEYDVKVDYKQALYSPDFAQLIQDTMNWRTTQVPRAFHVANAISPSEFLNLVRSNDRAALARIRDADGNQALAASDIDGLLREFGREHQDRQRDVEEIVYEDRPSITISGEIKDGTGKLRRIAKSFHQLSLGQQQAICLTILLHSGENAPLIIDQPEDNLDSEFIFKTLVATLRRIKERRQVIVVTHNANIAVLGDAELILPLRSTHERSVITSRGSIDKPETKEISCTILEGGKVAFQRRQEMYSI